MAPSPEVSSASSPKPKALLLQHVVSSAEQIDEAWELTRLHAQQSSSACALQLATIALSERLLTDQQHARVPPSLPHLLTAPAVVHSLCALDLSYNHLDDSFWMTLALESISSRWSALTSLNLANNMFTHKSLRPLGQLVARCRKLSHLDLSINPLMAPSSGRSEDVAHPSPFTALAQSLEVCKLAALDLSCTGVSDTDIAALLDGAALSHVTMLYLRSNALGDATAIALAERLPTVRLQVLSLAGNRVTNRGLGALAFALEGASTPLAAGLSTPSTLETLDLDANLIDERGIAMLYHVLDDLTSPFHLRYLHLERNSVAINVAPALLASLHVKLQEKILETQLLAIGATDPPQRTLGLTGKAMRAELLMSSVMTDSLVKVALDTIRHADVWSRLEELDLSGNAIAERGCFEIGLYLSLHSRLRVLDLSRNAIDDRATVGLADGLERNATLQELTLHENLITDAGAKTLFLKAFTTHYQRKVHLNIGNQLTSECKVTFAAVSQAQDLRARFASEYAHLEKLVFVGRGLRQFGAAAIADVLTDPTRTASCTAIDLSRNGLGDEGAVEVARLLREYPPLLSLNLSFNDISDIGACALAEALRENATLTSLALHTSVDGSSAKPRLLEPGLAQLAQALMTHASIMAIDLRDNVTTPALVQTYVQLLQQNPRIEKFNGASAAAYLARNER